MQGQNQSQKLLGHPCILHATSMQQSSTFAVNVAGVSESHVRRSLTDYPLRALSKYLSKVHATVICATITLGHDQPIAALMAQ